ncbi:hypothetical protein [Aeromonas dhakensis]|uniref:hypothetical protein n=1 Tax=Aeromonas dhakensis TaxID=196024 RepID=UPI0038D1652F
MKLRYFGYFIRNRNAQDKFLYNIKGILDAFTAATNLRLKSSFMVAGDSVFLTKIDGFPNQFYFVRTSDADLVKRINRRQITIGDIQDRLEKDEDIAFASYLYVSSKDCLFAVASTQGAPRFDALADYINSLFHKIGLGNYEVNILALTDSPTKESILKMDVVNSIYVDVDANSKKGNLLKELFLKKDSDGIGTFRVTIESKHGNLKDIVPVFVDENPVEKVDDTLESLLDEDISDRSGIIKVGFRGKHNELAGQLMDLWLENASVLSDTLNPKAKRLTLPMQISQKFDDNVFRTKLYADFIIENELTHLDVNALNKYNDIAPFEDSDENG